jgi:hypothetical protein
MERTLRLSEPQKGLKEVLSDLMNDALELNYSVPVDSDYARALFFDLVKEYDPGHKDSRPEWISGKKLLKRWQIEQPVHLYVFKKDKLPIYLWSLKTGDMKHVNLRIPEPSVILRLSSHPNITLNHPLPDSPYRPTNFWFAVPQWWWLRFEDVEFHEKVDPHLRTIVSPLTADWNTCEEVENRWGINAYELEKLVRRKKGLPAWRLDFLEGIILADEQHLVMPPKESWRGVVTPLSTCMFKPSELKAFEKEHDKYRKRRSKKEKDESVKNRIEQRLATLSRKNPKWRDIDFTTQIMHEFESQLPKGKGTKWVRKIVSNFFNPERKRGRRTK